MAAIAVAACLAAAAPSRGGEAPYELVVGGGVIDVTGRPVPAMTVNGSVPGPVLRWREGEIARIRVRNELAEPTSIHWHGVLVPPGMDGVPWVSFPPIPAGGSFTYEFPVRQSGTYWYHSHSGLQEQRGVYGAIVVEPRAGGGGTDREHVVVLSDWTDEDPARVLRTLKRGSHAYALEKGSAQSLLGAARAGMLGDFLATQLQRMPPMDIADVAYDRFLANGRPEVALAAEGLDTVRLRVVNGSATTYFHLEFAGGTMTVVGADGQDVEPFPVPRLLVAVAETYDLVVLVPPDGAWELRATAHDGSSHASAWIGAGERHPAPDVPRPNVYRAMAGLGLREMLALTPQGAMGMPDAAVRAGRFDRPGDAHGGHGGAHGAGAGHGGAGHGGAGHAVAATGGEDPGAPRHPDAAPASAAAPPSGRGHARDFAPLGPDASSAGRMAEEASPERPWSPYGRLRAVRPTGLPADRPVREVRLTLDGDMERYTWFLDGRALWEDDTIPVRAGETVRFILVNRTMMHHPMHLHGHFFRVVNGQGDRAPLKHTVDVPPMGTTVIEFAADELGDWLFHCHLLYHMESGMARVVRYEGFDPGPALAGGRVHGDHWHAWADVDLLTSGTAGAAVAASTRTTLEARWDAAWRRGERTDWEWLLSAERRVDAFLGVFAGADSLGTGAATEATRAVAGVRYLLPLLVRGRAWVDSAGGTRVAFEKELALVPRLEAHGEAEYDSHEGWDGAVGLRYALGRAVSLAADWDAGRGWGAGVALRF